MPTKVLIKQLKIGLIILGIFSIVATKAPKTVLIKGKNKPLKFNLI